MSKNILSVILFAGAAVLLGGCDNSSSSGGAGGAAAPAGGEMVVAGTPLTPATPATPVPPAAAANDAVSQLLKSAEAQPDKVLGALGMSLATKVKTLGASLGANNAVKSQLDGAVQGLLGGKELDALGLLTQVTQAASLTPQQMQLAKDVGNAASAYVVQNNFATLPGAKSDVATIVESLTKGEYAAALPAMQKVAANANLTAPQKELITSLADKYAPGLKQATDALQQGIQGLPGVKK